MSEQISRIVNGQIIFQVLQIIYFFTANIRDVRNTLFQNKYRLLVETKKHCAESKDKQCITKPCSYSVQVSLKLEIKCGIQTVFAIVTYVLSPDNLDLKLVELSSRFIFHASFI